MQVSVAAVQMACGFEVEQKLEQRTMRRPQLYGSPMKLDGHTRLPG